MEHPLRFRTITSELNPSDLALQNMEITMLREIKQRLIHYVSIDKDHLKIELGLNKYLNPLTKAEGGFIGTEYYDEQGISHYFLRSDWNKIRLTEHDIDSHISKWHNIIADITYLMDTYTTSGQKERAESIRDNRNARSRMQNKMKFNEKSAKQQEEKKEEKKEEQRFNQGTKSEPAYIPGGTLTKAQWFPTKNETTYYKPLRIAFTKSRQPTAIQQRFYNEANIMMHMAKTMTWIDRLLWFVRYFPLKSHCRCDFPQYYRKYWARCASENLVRQAQHFIENFQQKSTEEQHTLFQEINIMRQKELLKFFRQILIYLIRNAPCLGASMSDYKKEFIIPFTASKLKTITPQQRSKFVDYVVTLGISITDVSEEREDRQDARERAIDRMRSNQKWGYEVIDQAVQNARPNEYHTYKTLMEQWIDRFQVNECTFEKFLQSMMRIKRYPDFVYDDFGISTKNKKTEDIPIGGTERPRFTPKFVLVAADEEQIGTTRKNRYQKKTKAPEIPNGTGDGNYLRLPVQQGPHKLTYNPMRSEAPARTGHINQVLPRDAALEHYLMNWRTQHNADFLYPLQVQTAGSYYLVMPGTHQMCAYWGAVYLGLLQYHPLTWKHFYSLLTLPVFYGDDSNYYSCFSHTLVNDRPEEAITAAETAFKRHFKFDNKNQPVSFEQMMALFYTTSVQEDRDIFPVHVQLAEGIMHIAIHLPRPIEPPVYPAAHCLIDALKPYMPDHFLFTDPEQGVSTTGANIPVQPTNLISCMRCWSGESDSYCSGEEAVFCLMVNGTAFNFLLTSPEKNRTDYTCEYMRYPNDQQLSLDQFMVTLHLIDVYHQVTYENGLPVTHGVQHFESYRPSMVNALNNVAIQHPPVYPPFVDTRYNARKAAKAQRDAKKAEESKSTKKPSSTSDSKSQSKPSSSTSSATPPPPPPNPTPSTPATPSPTPSPTTTAAPVPVTQSTPNNASNNQTPTTPTPQPSSHSTSNPQSATPTPMSACTNIPVPCPATYCDSESESESCDTIDSTINQEPELPFEGYPKWRFGDMARAFIGNLYPDYEAYQIYLRKEKKTLEYDATPWMTTIRNYMGSQRFAYGKWFAEKLYKYNCMAFDHEGQFVEIKGDLYFQPYGGYRTPFKVAPISPFEHGIYTQRVFSRPDNFYHWWIVITGYCDRIFNLTKNMAANSKMSCMRINVIMHRTIADFINAVNTDPNYLQDYIAHMWNTSTFELRGSLSRFLFYLALKMHNGATLDWPLQPLTEPILKLLDTAFDKLGKMLRPQGTAPMAPSQSWTNFSTAVTQLSTTIGTTFLNGLCKLWDLVKVLILENPILASAHLFTTYSVTKTIPVGDGITLIHVQRNDDPNAQPMYRLPYVAPEFPKSFFDIFNRQLHWFSTTERLPRIVIQKLHEFMTSVKFDQLTTMEPVITGAQRYCMACNIHTPMTHDLVFFIYELFINRLEIMHRYSLNTDKSRLSAWWQMFKDYMGVRMPNDIPVLARLPLDINIELNALIGSTDVRQDWEYERQIEEANEIEPKKRNIKISRIFDNHNTPMNTIACNKSTTGWLPTNLQGYNCVPKVVLPTDLALYWAFEVRQGTPSSYPDVKVTSDIMRFVRNHPPRNFEFYHHYSDKDYIEHALPSKRTMLKRGFTSFSEKYRIVQTMEAMIKRDEKQPFDPSMYKDIETVYSLFHETQFDFIKPRFLNNPHHTTKAVIGHIAYNFLQNYENLFNRNVFELRNNSLPSSLVQGLNMTELAQKIQSAIQVINRSFYFYSYDSSRHDAHQNIRLLDIDNYVNAQIFNSTCTYYDYTPQQLRAIRSYMRCKELNVTAYTKLGRNQKTPLFRASIKGTVASGLPHRTTWGNAIRLIYVHEYLRAKYKLSPEFMFFVSGDDVITMVPDEDCEAFERGLKELYMTTGKTGTKHGTGMVLKEVIKERNYFEFLSKLGLVNTQNEVYIARIPLRVIQTGLSSKSDLCKNQLQSYLGCINYSLSHDSVNPLVESMMKHFPLTFKQSMLKTLRRSFHDDPRMPLWYQDAIICWLKYSNYDAYVQIVMDQTANKPCRSFQTSNMEYSCENVYNPDLSGDLIYKNLVSQPNLNDIKIGSTIPSTENHYKLFQPKFVEVHEEPLIFDLELDQKFPDFTDCCRIGSTQPNSWLDLENPDIFDYHRTALLAIYQLPDHINRDHAAVDYSLKYQNFPFGNFYTLLGLYKSLRTEAPAQNSEDTISVDIDDILNSRYVQKKLSSLPRARFIGGTDKPRKRRQPRYVRPIQKLGTANKYANKFLKKKGYQAVKDVARGMGVNKKYVKRQVVQGIKKSLRSIEGGESIIQAVSTVNSARKRGEQFRSMRKEAALSLVAKNYLAAFQNPINAGNLHLPIPSVPRSYAMSTTKQIEFTTSLTSGFGWCCIAPCAVGDYESIHYTTSTYGGYVMSTYNAGAITGVTSVSNGGMVSYSTITAVDGNEMGSCIRICGVGVEVENTTTEMYKQGEIYISDTINHSSVEFQTQANIAANAQAFRTPVSRFSKQSFFFMPDPSVSAYWKPTDFTPCGDGVGTISVYPWSEEVTSGSTGNRGSPCLYIAVLGANLTNAATFRVRITTYIEYAGKVVATNAYPLKCNSNEYNDIRESYQEYRSQMANPRR